MNTTLFVCLSHDQCFQYETYYYSVTHTVSCVVISSTFDCLFESHKTTLLFELLCAVIGLWMNTPKAVALK